MNEYIDDENTVQNSLVGIAIQYMDQDWQLVRHFLGNIFYHKQEDVEELQENLEKFMDEWGIKEVFTAVTEPNANLIEALKRCKRIKNVVRCVGHSCHKAIDDCVETGRRCCRCNCSNSTFDQSFR